MNNNDGFFCSCTGGRGRDGASGRFCVAIRMLAEGQHAAYQLLCLSKKGILFITFSMARAVKRARICIMIQCNIFDGVAVYPESGDDARRLDDDARQRSMKIG